MSDPSEDIKRRMERKEYDAALIKLAEMDLRTNPYLLLQASVCEQMSNQGSLERAKGNLKELVTRYPDFIDGLTHLGYFEFAVEDDAQSAIPVFEAAIALARKAAREASIGKAKCLLEMGDKGRALDTIVRLALPPHEQNEILEELGFEPHKPIV